MPKKFETKLPPPWLKRVWIKDDLVEDRKGYPFHLPLFRAPGFELEFDSPVTILVGDNGSEAVWKIGFGIPFGPEA